MARVTLKINFDRLHKIGFTLKCCEVCLHSRFYDKTSWGLCANHGTNEAPLRIHKSGRCRRGFKPDIEAASKSGLNNMGEFL